MDISNGASFGISNGHSMAWPEGSERESLLVQWLLGAIQDRS